MKHTRSEDTLRDPREVEDTDGWSCKEPFKRARYAARAWYVTAVEAGPPASHTNKVLPAWSVNAERSDVTGRHHAFIVIATRSNVNTP